MSPIESSFHGEGYTNSTTDSPPPNVAQYTPSASPVNFQAVEYSPPPDQERRTPAISDLLLNASDEAAEENMTQVSGNSARKMIPFEQPDYSDSDNESVEDTVMETLTVDKGKARYGRTSLIDDYLKSNREVGLDAKADKGEAKESPMAGVDADPIAEVDADPMAGVDAGLINFTESPLDPLNFDTTDRINELFETLHVGLGNKRTFTSDDYDKDTTMDVEHGSAIPNDAIDPTLLNTPTAERHHSQGIDPRHIHDNFQAVLQSPPAEEQEPRHIGDDFPVAAQIPPAEVEKPARKTQKGQTLSSRAVGPVVVVAKRKATGHADARNKKKRTGKDTSNCKGDSVQGNPADDFADLDVMDVDIVKSSLKGAEGSDGTGSVVFCDYCSDGGKMLICSVESCNIALCYSKDLSACVTWDGTDETPWFCVYHNSKLDHPLKYKLNTRSKSFLHGGRKLQPLLYIHVYPCETNMDKDLLTSPTIQSRMHDFYKHDETEMFKSVSVYLNSGVLISKMREDVRGWIAKNPRSAVLVVVEGHSAISTGEIVYSPSGSSTNKHAQIDVILRYVMGQGSLFDDVFTRNPSQKGLLIVSCGHTFRHFASMRSWKSLVNGEHFTWVVGFSATVLSPIKVTPILPSFVEHAFLRGRNRNVQDAVCRTFDREDLLSHTGVLVFQKETRGTLSELTVKEFVLSNQDRPWGLELPKCPTCQLNMFMKANIEGDRCNLRCSRCTSTASGICRPRFVTPCEMAHLRVNKYFTIPFLPNEDLVVEDKLWKKRPFVPQEQ